MVAPTGLHRPIEVVGHGGAAAYAPGNSRRAIELALEFRVDRVECDVQRSADGHLVLVHDDRVHLPDGRRQPVRSLSATDLRRLLPGLLTLDDAAEMTRGRAPLMIDVKRSGYEAELIAAIRRHHLDAESSVSSTYASTLIRVRAAFPSMRTGLSTGHWATGTPTAAGRAITRWALRAALPLPLLVLLPRIGATETMLHYHVTTAALVAALHATGRRVNVWTVDRPKSIARALALGVDGIISNRPDLVQAVNAGIPLGPLGFDR